MDIVFNINSNGKPRYHCPHCNAPLTATLRNPICRKCHKPVSWKNIPK
jgi:transposase-like protein